MVAATADRNTKKRDGDVLDFPVKANTKIFQGTLVVLDAGYAAPGRTAVGLIAVGMCLETVDNTGGAAGALKVRVDQGTFQFANSSAGDLIAQADVGADCFIVDDQTLAKTNGTNTRSRAGKITAVESTGVWVHLELGE
jgi:hypothetical protein